MTEATRRLIRDKTDGRCHVCGGPLGKKWQADHVRPKARGGADIANNYLPACRICNQLRWHRRSKVIRKCFCSGATSCPK
jgi:hypothetical protein